MSPTRTFGPCAIVIACVLGAAPAFAQHQEDHRGQDRGGQQQRASENRGGQQQRGGENRGGQQQHAGENRGGQQRASENRGEPRGEQRGAPRGTAGHEDRGNQPRRGEEMRGGGAGPRGAYRGVPRANEYRSRAYTEPRAYGYERPHVRIPVVPYGRPYYFFRPRFSIGFGVYLGYPVPYPVPYGPPAYVFGYPGGVVMTPPPAGEYGGISFDIQPDDATVSVDGAYVGIARDFSPMNQPLTLTPGRHHVELQAPDMVPLGFDVDIVAGQVVPFSGALQPQ